MTPAVSSSGACLGVAARPAPLGDVDSGSGVFARKRRGMVGGLLILRDFMFVRMGSTPYNVNVDVR